MLGVDTWSAHLENLRRRDCDTLAQALLGAVAHAIGTPLNVISGRAGLIAQDCHDVAETTRNATIITEQVQHVSRLLQHYLTAVRKPSEQQQQTPQLLWPLLTHAITLVEPWAADRDVTLHMQSESMTALQSQWVVLHTERAIQLLTHMLTHAAQATAPKTAITISGTQSTPPAPEFGISKPSAPFFRLTLSHEGPCISPDALLVLNDPFAIAHHPHEKPDFGVWICHQILRTQGGRLIFENHPEGGRAMHVFLPIGGGEK